MLTCGFCLSGDIILRGRLSGRVSGLWRQSGSCVRKAPDKVLPSVRRKVRASSQSSHYSLFLSGLGEQGSVWMCAMSPGFSWVIYEEKNYSGSLYVLSEGDYPNLSSMGCPSSFTIGSVKAVAVVRDQTHKEVTVLLPECSLNFHLSSVQTFTVPSISLFSLECLEGREITTQTEITSMVEEGFNNHILSVRVNSGWWDGVFLHCCAWLLCDRLAANSSVILWLCSWVICEHSNYRGRQFFLEPIEITNWLKFSSLQTVGSLFPVRQVSFMYILFFACWFWFGFYQTATNRNVQKHLAANFTTNVVTFAWWF